jgi:acyl-CoA reductase-like NAD-dependent aldehyde dehydrogenase
VSEAAFRHLHAIDRSQGGLSLAERKRLLRALQAAVVERRERIVAAIDADFGGRSAEETVLAEVLGVANAASFARRHLDRWARPRRVPTDLPFWPARARIVPQPLGIVGIIAPWNYPLHLALGPAVGALSAGNRLMLKPSELTPRAASELAALVDAVLGPEVAVVVEGGAEVAAAFTRLPFDHLLYTGSTARGREVMRAAAENLTPVTLELGGKCPVIVTADADLDLAARAIVTGKGLNAGQTCIAPDTVLLVGLDPAGFRARLRASARRLYPGGLPTAVAPSQRKHLDLTSMPADEPLLVTAATLRDREIFGPILPVEAHPSLASALAWIAERPSPLAVYLFSRSRSDEAAVLAGTRAGALVVNGTILQAAIEALPFGGVGASGFGRYHGRAGFDTFSNMRAVVHAPRWSLARLVEPPYTGQTRELIERIVRLAAWR